MSATEGKGAPAFYFKSYDRVIGVAHTTGDLRRKVSRLADENPGALEYHLKEGHIVRWLESMNEKGLAEELRGVQTAAEAREWARKPQERGASKEQAARPPAPAARKARDLRKR